MNLKNMSWHKQPKCVTLYVCINSLPKLDKYHDKKNFVKLSGLYLSKNVASWLPVVYFLQSDLFFKAKSRSIQRKK